LGAGKTNKIMKVVIVGPCGVGKSTVAKFLANRANTLYIDFDEIGIQDMKKRKGKVSPFSASRLNFMQSIPTIIPNTTSTRFVLDIGGDTVFRKKADNDKRLAQVIWLKETYTSPIIVLLAKKDVLQKRFVSTKKRSENEFDEIWQNWIDVAEPNWKKCGDIFIDTSFLTVDETIKQIETNLKYCAGQYE
jgi:shikimate kinase